MASEGESSSEAGQLGSRQTSEQLLDALTRYSFSTRPLTRRFDRAQHKEVWASRLALGLMIIFGGTIGAVLAYAFVDDKPGAVDLATTILPYTGTPLAMALGYYFGISAR